MRTPAIVFTGIFVAASSPHPAFAQPAANPISGSIRSAWDSAKRNIQQSAELMPDANYSFKPVDSVRTFGEILAHLAGANYVFCAAAKGEKTPHAEDEFEKAATTRAQITKALADSIAYCDAAYASLDDKRAGEIVDMPFGMGKAPRSSPLILNANHLNEHYGNLVTYFRIRGIVPPSSRQP